MGQQSVESVICTVGKRKPIVVHFIKLIDFVVVITPQYLRKRSYCSNNSESVTGNVSLLNDSLRGMSILSVVCCAQCVCFDGKVSIDKSTNWLLQ